MVISAISLPEPVQAEQSVLAMSILYAGVAFVVLIILAMLTVLTVRYVRLRCESLLRRRGYTILDDYPLNTADWTNTNEDILSPSPSCDLPAESGSDEEAIAMENASGSRSGSEAVNWSPSIVRHYEPSIPVCPAASLASLKTKSRQPAVADANKLAAARIRGYQSSYNAIPVTNAQHTAVVTVECGDSKIVCKPLVETLTAIGNVRKANDDIGTGVGDNDTKESASNNMSVGGGISIQRLEVAAAGNDKDVRLTIRVIPSTNSEKSKSDANTSTNTTADSGISQSFEAPSIHCIAETDVRFTERARGGNGAAGAEDEIPSQNDTPGTIPPPTDAHGPSVLSPIAERSGESTPLPSRSPREPSDALSD